MIEEFVKSGHFYSVIPNIDNNYKYNNGKIYDKLDFNDDSHKNILGELQDSIKDYHFPLTNMKKKMKLVQLPKM